MKSDYDNGKKNNEIYTANDFSATSLLGIDPMTTNF